MQYHLHQQDHSPLSSHQHLPQLICMVNFFITICVQLFPILINLQVWHLVVSFFLCGDLSWKFKTKQLLNKYGHDKIVNGCKCSCFAGVESVDGATVLGKLQNEC